MWGTASPSGGDALKQEETLYLHHGSITTMRWKMMVKLILILMIKSENAVPTTTVACATTLRVMDIKGIALLLWYLAGIACCQERRTRDYKVASSNPSRSGGRIFFSKANFVCWLLFGVRSTSVLSQWHAKDPGHSAKMLVTGYVRPQSSQLAEPLWTDSGLKSGIGVRELISTQEKKKKKKSQAGNEWSNILIKSSQARKEPPPPLRICHCI